MSKIRRIQDFQHSFSFSSQQEQFGAFFDRFLESDLGKIYRAVLWDDTVSALGLKNEREGLANMQDKEKTGGRHHQGKGELSGGKLRKRQGTLWPETHPCPQQGHRDPMDIFGIHTANALEIGRRMAGERLQTAA